MRRDKKTGSPRQSKKIGRFLVPIVLVLVLVVCAVFWQWSLHTVFAKNAWRTNILARSASPTIVSFPNDSTDKVFVLVLPKEVETTVPYGYGVYRLEALPKLVEIEKKEFLDADTIEDMLGVQLKSTVQAQGDVDVEEVLGSLKRQLSFGNQVNWENKNNFDIIDTIILSTKLKLLKPSDVLVFDLREDRYLFPVKTSLDQAKLLTVNQQPLDEFIESKFTQELVRTENLTVSVHNTTGTAGAGNKFARFIANIGGKVLMVENDTAEIEGCQIRLKQQHAQSVLAKYLQKEFDCEILNSEEGDVADIVVLVGKYFAKRWG